MANRPISHWQARVVRSRNRSSTDDLAIHEVYYDESGDVVTYTEDALSPRASSVDALRGELLSLLQQEGSIVCGDKGYGYAREDVEEWIASLEQPILEIE